MAARGILDDLQAGQDYVSGLFDQRARLQAGRAYAGGDYAGASGLLASRGDLESAERLSQRGARTNVLSAVDNKDFGAARAAAAGAGNTELYGAATGAQNDDAAQKTEWLTHAADALKQLPAEARHKAFSDYIAPTIKMMGADDAMLSAIDATHLTDESLDAFKASLGGKSGKRIEKVGDSLVEVGTDGTAREIFKAPAGSKVVGNSLVTDDGRVLYTAPEIRSVGEGQSLVEIPGGGPASAGGADSPRGLRNNNPGNIEDGAFAKSQPGYKGSDGRFAIFDTAEAGQGAQAALLQSYGSKGINTISAAVSRWAPKTDGNDPVAYAGYVAQKLGVSPDTQIDLTNPKNARAVAKVMADYENGGQSPSQGGAARVVATGQPKRENAPAGYRYRPDNTMEPIPGGPADPTIIQANKAGGNRKGEADLRKEFNARAEVKEYKAVQGAYNQIKAVGSAKPTAPGDMSLVFSYMKMLDPGSVVREGEFASAQNAAGIPDRVINAYNKARDGQLLNPKQRNLFIQTADTIAKAQKTRYDQVANEYRGYAQDYDLSPDRIVTDGAAASPKPALRTPPKVGEVKNGYRYKGGNPSQPSSWVKQ